MTYVEWETSFISGESFNPKTVKILGQAGVSYAILNQHVPLLASDLYYPFENMPNVLSGQPIIVNVIVNQATP